MCIFVQGMDGDNGLDGYDGVPGRHGLRGPKGEMVSIFCLSPSDANLSTVH